MKEDTRLRNELIIADYNNGYAIKILERKYELSHTSLLRVLKENGVEFKMGRASLKPHTIDNIVKLYEMGKSTQQIVKELKLSKSSLFSSTFSYCPTIISTPILFKATSTNFSTVFNAI